MRQADMLVEYSPLAPFVAAVLKDKTTADLLDQVQKFRSIVQFSQQVEVTGAKGTPVYAYGSLAEGKEGTNPGLWRVDLKVVKKFPISQLNDVQVTLGGVKLAEFDDFDRLPRGFYDNYDSAQVFGENYGGLDFGFGGKNVIWVESWFGPIARDHYKALSTCGYYSDQVLEFLPELHNENPARLMMITCVQVDKRTIYGALGVLESQGIHTNRDFQFED